MMDQDLKIKYAVIKLTDVEKYLPTYEQGLLKDILEVIEDGREAEGKQPNFYYVCNTDEPYADAVIETILDGEKAKHLGS
jgi:hypothetical protein